MNDTARSYKWTFWFCRLETIEVSKTWLTFLVFTHLSGTCRKIFKAKGSDISQHSSHASGVCVSLGGLDGNVPGPRPGLGVLQLGDGGGRLLERLVPVASPLLPHRRPNASRVRRECFEINILDYWKLSKLLDQFDIFTQHRENPRVKAAGWQHSQCWPSQVRMKQNDTLNPCAQHFHPLHFSISHLLFSFSKRHQLTQSFREIK